MVNRNDFAIKSVDMRDRDGRLPRASIMPKQVVAACLES